MTKETKPAAAEVADVAVVLEHGGQIQFVTEARAQAIETSGEGRRAIDHDLAVAGVERPA